jgi:hypothetical protein
LAHTFTADINRFLNSNPTHTVSLIWTASHSNIPGNERADELAKNGGNLASSAPPYASSFANMKRRAKEKMLNDWTKIWKSTPRHGHFAISNRFPPSLKPTKRLTHLENKGEIFGRVIQCRTGHGYLGEYYNRFVPSKDIDCPCGEHIQTREHVLRDCIIYEQHRNILRETSETIALPVILGSEGGVEALALFLEKSGALTKHGNPYTRPPPPSLDDEPEDLSSGEEE